MSALVSIVIPCYRQGRWLAEAVNSCLAQSYPHLEVIVVDDGSDDETRSVASAFHSIVYHYQTNAGQSAARNAGIELAKGEYVLFLDADDALHRNAIETLMTVTDGKTIGMIGWKPFEHDVRESTVEVFPPLESPIASLLKNNPGPPHMFLSPMKYVRSIGGWDRNLTGTSDWDCWYRQLFSGADLKAVPFIGAYYRQSPGQLSRNELIMTEMLAKASVKLLALAQANPQRLSDWGMNPQETIRDFRNRAGKEYAHLAYLYRQRGQRKAAAKCYLKAGRLGHRRSWKSLMALPLRRGQ